MSKKIIDLHSYRKINFIQLKELSPKQSGYDADVRVNNIPFLIENVYIKSVNKDRVLFNFGSFIHNIKDATNSICPFCKEEPIANTVCETLSNEKKQLMSLIGDKILFPLLQTHYHNIDVKTIRDNVKIDNNFKALFYGISEEKYLQCIFQKDDELFFFQDVIDNKRDEYIPLIFFRDEASKEIHLNIEMLLPENFINIYQNITHCLINSNIKIYETTGLTIEEIFSEYNPE